MSNYFDIACDVENIVDNALTRCFEFGDSSRSIRRVLDHAIYLQQELSYNKEALQRCEIHSQNVDRCVDRCQQVFRGYCALLDDIANSNSPELLFIRLEADIADFRIRLDTAHESLTFAIDDFENGPPRRPALPRPISYNDYDVLDRRDQLAGPAGIRNSNLIRRRSTPLYDDFDLPRAREPLGNRRQRYRFSEMFEEEEGPVFPDDSRAGGYRHVRRFG